MTKKGLYNNKYLVIKGGTVRETVHNSSYFKDMKNKLIYKGDGFYIYDEEKTRALPLVRMLLEDFEEPKNWFNYLIFFVLLIVGFLSFAGIKEKIEIKDYTNNFLSLSENIQKLSIKKMEKQQTSIITTTNTGTGTETEKEKEKEKENIKINNENEVNKLKIEKLNREKNILELEKEKYKILAQNKINKLDIYKDIKADFLIEEKEKMKKTVKLEYLEEAKKECKEQIINNIKFLCQKYDK